MQKHTLMRACIAGIVVLPLIALAQGTADGTAPIDGTSAASGTAQTGTGTAPAGSTATGTSSGTLPQPVLSDQPAPSAAQGTATQSSSGTPAPRPGAAASQGAVQSTNAAPQTVVATGSPGATTTAVVDDESNLLVHAVEFLLVFIPFGFVFMYVRKRMARSSSADDTRNRCFDIEQLLKDKLNELTDVKAMVKEKAIETGKEAMRDALSGTATGDLLVKLEKAEAEYNRLKQLYEECKIDIDRYRYKGVLIENSLLDTRILEHVRVIQTREMGDWIVHDIRLSKSQIEDIQKNIADRSWYFHLWEPGKDAVTVVFKDAIFEIKHSDRSTWREAIAHGIACGIPESQLDFAIE